MAGLSDQYGAISIKAFLGLLHTDDTKGLNNESDTLKLNLEPDEIWIDLFGKSRSQAETLGLVESVTCELAVDNTSNDHTFKVKLPSGYSGDLGSPGDVVTKIVNQRYGSDYAVTLKTSSDVVIPALDSREWFLNFSRVYQDDTTGSTPGKLDCYIYKGKTLADYMFPKPETLTDGATVTIDTKGRGQVFHEWSCGGATRSLSIANERTNGEVTFMNVTMQKTITGDVALTIPSTHADTDTVKNFAVGDASLSSNVLTFSGSQNGFWEIVVKIWKSSSTHYRIYTVAKLDE